MATSRSKRAAGKPARISVGIGSWTDKEYTGVIFPKGLAAGDRLKVYAQHFDHVEVNSSYHRLPLRAWVENWVAQTPGRFLFDFKLHRRFAQSPTKAAQDGRLMRQLLDVVAPLIEARKFGTFFLVLPPSFGPGKRRLEELDTLCEKLAPHPLAVELRHSGWVDADERERTLAYFAQRKLVWIAVDMPRIKGSTIMPPVDAVTNPHLAYLRLHGRRQDWLEMDSAAARHTYAYRPAELKQIAARVRGLAEKARAVRVVANNHARDFAPKAALALQKLLGRER